MTQLDLLKRASEVLAEMGVSYMVVGSLASSAYSEARYTNDIDIAVWLEPEDLPVLCRAFPSPRYYVSEQAAREALQRRTMFNVIDSDAGQKIDFMIAERDMWSREQFWRRRKIMILGEIEVFTAAPEDVIIGKLRYFKEGRSEKHLRDIAGMMEVSGSEIDEACILRWVAEFRLEEAWAEVMRRIGR